MRTTGHPTSPDDEICFLLLDAVRDSPDLKHFPDRRVGRHRPPPLRRIRTDPARAAIWLLGMFPAPSASPDQLPDGIGAPLELCGPRSMSVSAHLGVRQVRQASQGQEPSYTVASPSITLDFPSSERSDCHANVNNVYPTPIGSSPRFSLGPLQPFKRR